MCRPAVHDSFEKQWECEAAFVNMFSSTLSNPFIIREGEAPAEPMRRQLGRSLALPLAITDELNWSPPSFVFVPYPNQLMT